MRNVSRREMLAVAAAMTTPVGPAFAQETGMLRVTAASSDLSAMWRELIKAFEERHPGIRVRFENATRNYDDLVQATLRDAVTSSLADVSFQGANRIRVLADRNLAVPLDSFLEADQSASRKALSPSVSAIGKVNDKTLALGFGVAVPLVFYNLDLVRRAGLGPVPQEPAAWDAIIRIAEGVQRLGDDKLGAVFQYDSADWLWIALVESQGGRMMDPQERRVAFGDERGLRALQILERFGRAGQSRADMSRDQARQLFASGNLGLIIDSNSNLPAFERASAGKFELGVGRFPLPDPDGRLPAAGSVAMMLATSPTQQKLSWEFLKFVAGPEGQRVVGTASGWLPANEFAIRDPRVLGQFYETRPLTRPGLDQVPLLNGWYAFPGENAIKITKTLVDHMRTVVTLKQAPEQALSAMERDVAALLPNA
jgi:multiple sugar transport system substrate-binding protein